MGERLTDEALAELEEMGRDLPRGPWRAGRMDTENYDSSEEDAPWKAVYNDEPDAPVHLGAKLPVTVARGYGGRCRTIATFIAAARNALPSLLAEVRAARASRASPDPAPDAEARLRAFAEQYEEVRLRFSPYAGDKGWCLEWWDDHAGCSGVVDGASPSACLDAAEAAEKETKP